MSGRAAAARSEGDQSDATEMASERHTDDTPRGRVRIRFAPSGRDVHVPAGVAVFDAASWNGIAIDSTCGGHGTCKKCKVRVIGTAALPTSLDLRAFNADELAAGWRLACRTQAMFDVDIEVPPLTTRPKAATVGVGRQVILRPAVQKRYVELSEPSLSDQTPDIERLLRELDDLELRVDLQALRSIGRALRSNDSKVTAVVVDDVLIDIEPGDTTAAMYGLAFDLGTTTVVATLLDLSTGTPAAARSALNRQQPFGADVITRISAVMTGTDALERLRSLAHETLAALAGEVCEEAGVDPKNVYEVALAGNATMTHIILGVDPEPLGVAPFILSTRAFPEILASDLGVPVHPRARAVVFPSLGAYVGGDIIAGLLASGMDRDQRMRLFIDVGTNCEIVLGNRDRLIGTAAPAGPAFEGAAIRCGMRAEAGAIEGVSISPEGVDVRVIGDTAPLGLCGSGLVDAVAELLKVGLLDNSGRFIAEEAARTVAPQIAERLSMIGDERVFVLSEESQNGGARVFSPSAMYANCSSRRPPSRPDGAFCSRRPGSPPPTSSRSCSPDRSARICRRRAPYGSASCLRSRRCASSVLATSPAREQRWRSFRSVNAPEPSH